MELNFCFIHSTINVRAYWKRFNYTTTKFYKLCTPRYINFLLVKEIFAFAKNTS